jgi:hypothetical protein
VKNQEAPAYQAPTVTTLGTVEEYTQSVSPDKCGGTSDAALPLQLTPRYGTPRC